MTPNPVRNGRFCSGLVVVGLAVMSIAAGNLAAVPRAGADDASLFGEGGSFAEPIVNKLEQDGAATIAPLLPGYFNANVDQGREDFASGAADFAVSEFPLTSDEAATAQKNGRSFAYVPFAAQAVAIGTVILCNGDSSLQTGTLCPDIQLTVPQLAKVFANAVTTWNDPTFSQAQGGSPITPTSNSGNIVALHEVDPNYSTLELATLFENNSVAKPTWEAYLALNHVTNDTPGETWPTGGGQSGGDRTLADDLVPVNETTGIPQQDPQLWGAGDIAPLPSDWLGPPRNIPTVAIKNPAGTFVSPPRPGGTVDSMAAAEKYVSIDPSTNWVTFGYSTTDTSVYPIPAMSYLIVPTSGLDHTKAAALANFIRFVLGSQGQADVQALGAAPVTPAMVSAGLHTADEVAAQSQAPASGSTATGSTTSAGSGSPGASSTCSCSSAAATTDAAAASDSGPSLAFTGNDPWPLVVLGSVLAIIGLLGRRWLVRRPALVLGTALSGSSNPIKRRRPTT